MRVGKSSGPVRRMWVESSGTFPVAVLEVMWDGAIAIEKLGVRI